MEGLLARSTSGVGSFEQTMAVRASLLVGVCLLAAFAQPASGSGRVPRPDAPANVGISAAFLQSVSCASAGNCDAVGSYGDSSGEEALLVSERDGVWGDGLEASLPANAEWGPPSSRTPLQEALLWSVSCPSLGNCVAVGKYTTRSGFEKGLILAETGGVWLTGVAAPLPANARGDAVLRSVSCASVGNCAAVGNYRLTSNHHGGSLEGLVETERGGIWSGSEAALPADAHSPRNPGKPYWTPQRVRLESVACPSAGNCSAVGEYKDARSQPGKSDSQGLLLNESGGVWARGVEAVPPANAWTDQPRVELHSVSCPAAGDCAAVGGYLTYDSQGSIATWPGLLLTESGGTWKAGVEQAGVGPPSSAPFSENLPSVSCTSPRECVAAGSVEPGAGAIRPLLAVESGGQWQDGLQGPVPADASDYVVVPSVSCASAGSCAAVGGYHKNGSQWLHTLLLSEGSGSWQAAAALLPADAPPDAGDWLNWVSCPSAGNCAAVGHYTDTRDFEHSQALVISETGGTWGTGLDVLLPPSVDTRITHLKVEKRTAQITVLGVGRVLPLSFKCRLDRQPFASCPPTQDASQGAAAFPVRYTHLARGKHVFEVKTVDRQGTPDPTPAVARFRVK